MRVPREARAGRRPGRRDGAPKGKRDDPKKGGPTSGPGKEREGPGHGVLASPFLPPRRSGGKKEEFKGKKKKRKEKKGKKEGKGFFRGIKIACAKFFNWLKLF